MYTLGDDNLPQSTLRGNATSQGLPFDLQSVMNYFEFVTEGRSKPLTIFPHNDTWESGHSENYTLPTDLDILHINLLYCGGAKIKSVNYFLAQYAY